jgi:hypothetical protein
VRTKACLTPTSDCEIRKQEHNMTMTCAKQKSKKKLLQEKNKNITRI